MIFQSAIEIISIGIFKKGIYMFSLVVQYYLSIKCLKDKGHIANYPSVIAILTKRFVELIVDDFKRYTNTDDIKDMFVAIGKYDTQKKYKILLANFEKFTMEILNLDDNNLMRNNPIIEKYGIEWLEAGLDATVNISDFLEMVYNDYIKPHS